MATMPTRGDCWIVDLGMLAKVRPCLILSVPADDDHDRMLIARIFGSASGYRNLLFQRIQRLHEIASATGHLARFVVYGSFVTSKPNPKDVSPLIVFATAIPCIATNLTAEREQYHSVAGEARICSAVQMSW